MNLYSQSLSTILLVTLMFGFTASASIAAPLVQVKPNFVVIMTDDQGYQDLGCYGSPDIKTPRIDQMAKDHPEIVARLTKQLEFAKRDIGYHDVIGKNSRRTK